ncbi:hypothetical protein FACS1894159_05910 [Bacteroidia bacterium]|nr:hypothetical protein FACS1894159_05910 [Bacteroidia bacterium]
MKAKLLRLTLLLPLFALFFGCRDEVKSTWLVEANSDPMEVYGVVDPIHDDRPVSEMTLEGVIKLVGKNLANVDTVTINDVGLQIPFDAYVINGDLYLRVPYRAPIVIDNQIKITDKYERTVTVPLVVTLPALYADGLDFEWAAEGDQVNITGNYFDLYGVTADDGTVTFGGLPATIIAATKNTITVEVPAGATRDAAIVVSSPAGSATCSTPYRETTWLLGDFNGIAPSDNGNWHYQNTPRLTTSDPEPVDGIYLMYDADYPGEWSGDNWGIYFVNPGNYPADINTNRAAYNFKFEAWVGVSNMYNNLRFEFEASAAECRVWWGESPGIPLYAWRTVTIPAEKIKGGGGDADLGTAGPAFQMVMQGPTACHMYLAIDNPRFSLKPVH